MVVLLLDVITKVLFIRSKGFKNKFPVMSLMLIFFEPLQNCVCIPQSLSILNVPGHQDVFHRLEDLPPLQWLNVWADSLAWQELHCIGTLPIPPHWQSLLLEENWSAFIAENKITSDPHMPILDFLGACSAQKYWIHKNQLTPASFSLVQWDVLDRAICSFPHTFQMWLSKFASGHSAVGITMFHWKK